MDSHEDNDEVPTLSDEDIENLPTMSFENYLLAPYNNNLENKCNQPVDIPLCIGALFILIREKHEQELNQGHSFLEQPQPPHHIVKHFTIPIITECTEYGECRALLCEQSAAVIFAILIDILTHLKKPLFYLSERTVRVVEKLILLEPVHPYIFNISDVMYRESMAFCTDTGSSKQSDKKKIKKPDNITEFLRTLYKCDHVPKRETWHLINVFNKCMFNDLHMIEDELRRNTLRFIMKNVLFLARRYTLVNLLRLKRRRDETWDLNTILTRPHVTEFAATSLAKRLGPCLFRYPLNTCLPDEISIRTMINILYSNTDRLWMPKQHMKSILINMDPAVCHSNCVCGRGETSQKVPI